MKKVSRRELRRIVMSEAKRVTEAGTFVTSGPGMEIFQRGVWADPYSWNMVHKSSIMDVIGGALKAGVPIEKILTGVLPFQKEKVAAAAADAGFSASKPQPAAAPAASQGGYSSSEPKAKALTTQELFKLFGAGIKPHELDGINHSNLSYEMKQILGHYDDTRATRITGA